MSLLLLSKEQKAYPMFEWVLISDIHIHPHLSSLSVRK